MVERAEKTVENKASNIGGLIIETLIRNGLYEIAAMHAFNCYIPEILREMCEAEGVEGKTLLIKATHSAIAQEIIMQKESILNKINEILGKPKIREIRII